MSEPWDASRLVDVLTNGTGAEKLEGIEWLDACGASDERGRVRALVMHQLKVYAPVGEMDEESGVRRDARAWLLSALGRVSHDDQAAHAVLDQYLDPEYEHDRWGRHWALEGIFAGGDDSVLRFAERGKADPDPLVSCLALAILARAGDTDALGELRAATEENPWACLRALRIAMVLDKPILDRVLGIVREGSFSDLTYDAIIALGQVPPDIPEAEDAAQALSEYVRRHRWPMYDNMRTHALMSLGRLRSALSVPVLVEELTDRNPMVVLQAALALESALDSRTACRRILEAATRGNRPIRAYVSALRALNRSDVVNELESARTSGPAEQGSAALVLLQELGGSEALDRLRALMRTTEEYAAAQSKADAELQASLDSSLSEARQGFRIVAGMDIAVFVAGYALLAVGLYLVLSSDESLDRLIGAAASGGGFLGVVLKNWLVKSRDRVEPSVRRLASLQASFHGYLRQLRQVDQAYTQRVLAGKLEPDEVQSYTSVVETATRQAVDLLRGSGDGKHSDDDAA